MASHFELAWRDRRVGTMQTPRKFLDFIVDGESLYDRHGSDFISPLGWFVPEEDERAAARLLREAPAHIDDRVAIYVCPECGDLDCGAVTARIERDGDHIVWNDIAMSSPDYEAGGWHHDMAQFAEWAPLRFAARE